MRTHAKLLVAIAGMLLPVAAIAGPARADQPSANVCSTSSDDGWTTTICSDSPTEALVSKTWPVSSGELVQDIAKSCADDGGDTFRLMDVDLSPGRAVPRGVQVLELGGVGTTGLIQRDAQGFGDGVTGLSMFNWTVPTREVTIVLHCTSDPEQWYH